MKKQKAISIIRIFCILVAIGILSMASLASATEQEVTFKVQPNPKIDVVLAKSKTSTDVTNFKDNLLSALGTQGVNTDMVEISSVEAQKVDIAAGFEWQKDVSSSIGSISITNEGKNVVMKGNPSNPGKNAIWIIPEENQEQEFNFSYNIDYGDSFNAAGMLLRVQQSGNTLEGYMLSFNNTSGNNWYSAAGGRYGAIWKFTYHLRQNGANISKQLLKGININKSGTLNVKVTDSEIRVSGGGISGEEVYTFTNEYGVGYGFFSDHYSHGCDEIGSFRLTNIGLTTTKVRKFTEVLREPDWRDNSIRVLVNVGDVVNEELNQTQYLGELLSRLINENIHFVAWGKEVNQAQYENLISNNNGNGRFINNTDYNTSINTTAEYIKSLIDQIDTNNQYLLLDGQTELISEPPEVFNDTSDENYPYGKWKIIHDYSYYENNIGQFSKTRIYLDDMIKKFDKTGKFTVTYADGTVDPGEIYVHRRPNALIHHTKEGSNVTLISESSDLDQYSQGIHGISEEEWKYKKTTDAEWTTGKLTTLEDQTDYVVQLRVKDLQNTWSNPISVYVTNRTDAPPLAEFGIVNNIITKYDELEILDESYDPYGGTITSKTWEVYKGENQIYTGTEPPTKFEEVGEYSMRLTVVNDRNITSETYIRKFEIIEDTIPPEFIATPEECDWTQSVDVNLEFTDNGGSGFHSFKYAVSDTQAEPTDWNEPNTNNPGTVTITEEGKKFLHIKGTDKDGNESFDRVLGQYYIDHSGPNIEVTGDMESIVIDQLDLNLNVTDPFSGLKKVSINGQDVKNGTITFQKNGEYVIQAEDNIGNISSKTLNITNIYYECNAGLEHPIYSSDYDECPICESIKELRILDDEDKIYDTKPHEVIYENKSGGEILVYYDGSIEKPIQVKTYEYELKVKYKGEEYKTGVVGTFTILPKEVQIEEIVAHDKIYDGTTDIQLTDGRLVGIEPGDEVGFDLPEIGTASEKNVGSRYIAIDTIKLTGEKAFNYQLIQPEYGSVSATIEKRTITIKNVTAIERKFDDSNIVEIVGGELVNTIKNDDVKPIVPRTGTIESTDIGTWNVTIEDIELAGKDAKNYTLIQPELGEITATITKPTKPYLHLESYVQKINGKKISERPTVRIEEENSNPSQNPEEDENNSEEMDSEKTISTETESARTENVGTENTGTENTGTSDETTENEENPEEIENPKLKYEKQNPMPEIHYGDRLVLKFVVYNEGKGGGHAKTIQTTLPEGLKFVENSKLNEENGWKEEEGALVTDILSREKNRKNPISGIKQKEDIEDSDTSEEKEMLQGFVEEKENTNSEGDEQEENKQEENEQEEDEQEENQEESTQAAKEELFMEVDGQILSYKEVELEVEVIAEKVENTEIHVISEIKQTDIRNEQIPYEEEQEKQAMEAMKIRYVDLSLQQHIIKIQEQNKETGEILDHIIQPTEEMIKYEIHRKRIGNTVLKITYQFDVTNLGNETLTKGIILDKIPEGFEFVPEDNPGWKIAENGYLISPDLGNIEEKVTKAVTLVLSWQLKDDNIGERKNQAVVMSSQEIDQQMIEAAIRKEESTTEDNQTEDNQTEDNQTEENQNNGNELAEASQVEEENIVGKEIEDQKTEEEMIKIGNQLQETNNAAESEVFIGLVLGRVIKISILGALALAILLIGVIEIKKYVL